MTVPGWNAQEWHTRNTTKEQPQPNARKGPNWLTIGIVALLVGGAAVSASGGGKDKYDVGVCHATGNDDLPFVMLVVDKDSFEHGHHRHHEDDYFVSAEHGACVDAPIESEDGLEQNATDSEVEPEVSIDDNNATQDADEQIDEASNETEDSVEDSAPEPEPAPEDTSAGNETDESPEPGEQEVQNETAPLGNLVVKQTAAQDEFEVVLTITVSNAGEGIAESSELVDSLPDLRRTWYLGGADAADCVLDGQSLACYFEDLVPGESRSISVQAFTDRMPCGFALTNTAYGSALDDASDRDNASSASIAARAC